VSSARSRLRLDEGFSLIEVLVAITLLGLVSAAILPMLILGGRASTVVRFETIAKNLVQERLEQMRQLPFQVDRQNGPFIDLLDYYYPGRAAAANSTSSGWVASTSAARTAGEPTSGAFYRVVVPVVPDHPAYRQVITSQFLRADRTAVPDTLFSTYNSQVAGVDGPPSSYLGVSVITTWTVAGTPKRSVVYTEISNPGTAAGLISSQAQATAIRLQSTAPDQSVVTLVAGRVSAEGRLSDGSTASVRGVAAEATREGLAPLRGAYADASEPGATFTGTLSQTHLSTDSTGCGYGAFGRSENTNLTPSVAGGLPKVPSTVGTSATSPAAQARAALQTNAGGSCGTLSFDNLSSASYDPSLRLLTTQPLVRMPDLTSGSDPAVEGTAWLNATATSASPRFVTAGASARTAERLGLLPVSFAADGKGLLGVQLISSGITCAAGSPVSASYRVVVDVYRSITSGSITTHGRSIIADVSWSSGGAPPTPIDLSQVVYDDGAGTVLRLSNYFTDLELAGAVSASTTTEAASLPAAFRAATTPVRGAASPESGIELRVGTLACSAVDAR
jgi:prepilin-type N-terminal cleavage/methylation domain-containing protein